MSDLDKSYRRRMPIENMTEAEDRLMGMVIALTSQVASLRERLGTLKLALTRNGALPSDAIKNAELRAEDVQRRDRLRQSIIAKVIHPILDEMEHDAKRAGD